MQEREPTAPGGEPRTDPFAITLAFSLKETATGRKWYRPYLQLGYPPIGRRLSNFVFRTRSTANAYATKWQARYNRYCAYVQTDSKVIR